MRGTWDDVSRRLASSLVALDLDDVLVVRERAGTARPRGLLGLGPRRRVPPHRFVQVTALKTVLLAECVGSTSFGGDWEMTPEQEQVLERRGWDRPWNDELTTWQREAPLQRAPQLAVQLVAALRLLGCEVEDLDVELTRDEGAGG